ncbi:MAG: hypothetical protein ACFFCS_21740 [Candidatus Hodarchaeota archaeon]
MNQTNQKHISEMVGIISRLQGPFSILKREEKGVLTVRQKVVQTLVSLIS